MANHPNGSGKRRGCGPVLVFMIAIVFASLGVVVGAGGLYTYLNSSDDAVYRLGLAEVATAVETSPAVESYPVAYPLFETLEIPSGLDERAVRRRIQEGQDNLRQCYLEELQRSPDTRGELDVQFSVSGASGEVVAAVARGNHTGSEPLASCVLSTIRQNWTFSEGESSGVSAVRFRMLFLTIPT